MSSPSPREVLRRELGSQVAVALVASGLPVDSIARAVLESSCKPLGDLAKADPLAPSLAAQVGQLVHLAQLRAEVAVKQVVLAKCDRDQQGRLIGLPLVRASLGKASSQRRDLPGSQSIRPKEAPQPQLVTPSAQGKRPPKVRPPQASAVFAKHEATKPHPRCGQPAFEDGQFVGCLCWSELAKSATTLRTQAGYRVSVPADPRSTQMLRELGGKP